MPAMCVKNRATTKNNNILLMMNFTLCPTKIVHVLPVNYPSEVFMAFWELISAKATI